MGSRVRSSAKLIATLLVSILSIQQSLASDARSVVQEPRAILDAREPNSAGHLAVYFVEDNQDATTRILTPGAAAGASPLICDNNMLQEKARDHFTFTSFTAGCSYLGADRWQVPGPQDVDPRTSFIAAVISGIGNCQVAPQSACLASMEISRSNGTTEKLLPVRAIHDHYSTLPSTYDGTTKTGYPGGSSPWIWKSPNGPTEYLAVGSVLTWYNRPGSKDRRSLNLGIYPVNQVPAPSSRSGCGAGVATGSDFSTYCRLVFTDEERISIRLRVPNDLSGWLSGRLVDPRASIERFDSDYDEMIISASPAETIVVGNWIKVDSRLDGYFNSSIWWRNYANAAKTANGNTSWPGALVDIASQSVKIFGDLENDFGDRALANVKTWSISLSTANLPPCSAGKSGIQGLVATNAALYSSGAPTWDTTTRSLIYEVASPRLRADGSGPNIGNYGLSMPETLFKCIYGVSQIPSQAEVSVSYAASREPLLSTVALNSKNGWVYLSADNFTFSTPTIRVRLPESSQGKPSVPAEAKPEVKSELTERSTKTLSSKKKQITCARGTQKKRVQAKKCPKGFKKA